MSSGPLLRHQADISAPVPMPVDRVDDTSVSNTSTSETVVWYYISSSAWAAAVGQAAGTICTAKLTYSGVLNSMGTAVGSFNDTSLSFAAATRASTRVSAPEDLLCKMVFMSPSDQKAAITPYLVSAGDYIIDHRRGQIWLKSLATVANDSATYQYATPLSGGGTGDKVDVIKLGGIAIPVDDAAFTPATSTVMPIGFFADETAADSVNEGDIGAPRMTLDRRILTANLTTDDAAPETGTRVAMIGALADETSPDSVDEGDAGFLRMTLTRFLKTSMGDLISGEDQTNSVMQTVAKPLAVSTYTYVRDSSAALEASSISKASAGNLYRAFGVVDATAPTDIYYIQFLDSATLTGDGAVTHLITPIPVNHVNGTDSSFDTGHFDFGVAAANGIVIVLSTTMVTKTISGSYLFATTLTK